MNPPKSEIDRKKATELSVSIPGRGLTREKLLFQACLPWLSGNDVPLDSQAASLDALLRHMQTWRGSTASPVLMLPAQIHIRDIRRPQAGRVGWGSTGT